MRDGVALQDNGFYIIVKAGPNFDPAADDLWKTLEKKAKIVGQSYAWRSKSGNLTLDSLETCAGKDRSELPMQDLLEGFTQGVSELDQSVNRITVGLGGGTEEITERLTKPLSPSSSPEIMNKGFMYGDSATQAELYASPTLQEYREQAQDFQAMGIEITSESQIKLLQKYKASGEENYPEHFQYYLLYSEYSNKDLSKAVEMAPYKISALTSYAAMECYGDVSSIEKLEEIYEADSIKFLSLTSDDARECYKADINFEELQAAYDKDLSENHKVFEALIDPDAQECYEMGYLTFSDLAQYDDEGKIGSFTDIGAQRAYSDGMDIESLRALREKAKEIAQKEVTLTSETQLKILSQSKQPYPTYLEAHLLYAEMSGFNTISQIETTEELLLALTSEEAQECYKEKYFTFEQLKTCDAEKALLLTSDNIQDSFTRGLTFEQLSSLYDEDEHPGKWGFHYLSSPFTIQMGNLSGMSFEKIVQMYNEDQTQNKKKFYSIISQAGQGALEGGISIDKLDALYDEVGEEKFNSLLYATLYIAPCDKSVDIDKIKALLDNDQSEDKEKYGRLVGASAVGRIQSGTSLDDLENLYSQGVQKFDALINPTANFLYNSGVAFNELEKMYEANPEKTTFLTSKNIIALYSTGVTIETLSALYDKSPESVKALTSMNVVSAIIKSGGKHEEIIKHADNPELLDCICLAYLYIGPDYITIDELAELYQQHGKENIAALQRTSVATLCKGGVSIQELASHPNKLDAISNEACMALYEGGMNPKTLSEMFDKDRKKFESLTKPNMETVYNFFDLPFSYIQKLYDDFEDKDKFSIVMEQFIATIKKEESLELQEMFELYNICARSEALNFETIAPLCDQPTDIEKLTSERAIACYEAGAAESNINFVKDVPDFYDALTSPNAIELYRMIPDCCHKLSLQADIEKVQILISDEVIELYKMGLVTFEQLEQEDNITQRLAEEMEIKARLEQLPEEHRERAIQIRKSGFEDEFEAVTSKAALAAYEQGVDFDDLGELYKDNRTQYEAVTTDKKALQKFLQEKEPDQKSAKDLAASAEVEKITTGVGDLVVKASDKIPSTTTLPQALKALRENMQSLEISSKTDQGPSQKVSKGAEMGKS